MISIKDIARKCNVSISTVSKALNDGKDISSSTKTRILKVASELGYTANSSARALRTNKTNNIGILFTNTDAIFTHEFFANVLESFKCEVEKSGYDITFINDTLIKDSKTYLKYCQFRNFDGVVIITADFEDKGIKELANSEIPVVTIDHVYKNCTSVISDNTGGMSDLVEYAISMGHKKIAYIHGSKSWVTKDRLIGFYATMGKYKLSIPDEYIVEADYRDPTFVDQKTKQLLALKDPPTCILFPDDYSMISAIQTIKDSKNKISYIGFDGIKISKDLNITTYEQDRESLGKVAANKLIEQIKNPNQLIEHIVISGKVRIGDSVKRI